MTVPQTFQIRPFTVEAMRWTPDDGQAAQALLDWLTSLKVAYNVSDDRQTIILMAEGQGVYPGSWVFRMPTGLVATGPDEWFNRQYEPADVRPEIPVRAAPETWSAYLGNVNFAADWPSLREGDRISVTFDSNDNAWHGVVAGVRPGAGGRMWIDANPDPSAPREETNS